MNNNNKIDFEHPSYGLPMDEVANFVGENIIQTPSLVEAIRLEEEDEQNYFNSDSYKKTLKRKEKEEETEKTSKELEVEIKNLLGVIEDKHGALK